MSKSGSVSGGGGGCSVGKSSGVSGSKSSGFGASTKSVKANSAFTGGSFAAKMGFNAADAKKAALNRSLDAKKTTLDKLIDAKKKEVAGTPKFNGIKNVKNNPNVTADFKKKVAEMAQRLKTKPEYLMAVMSFESRLNPKAVNKVSKATGLIQFMPKTAKALGTSTAALKNMSATQQLKYVEKYFQQPQFKGKLNSLESVYTSVLAGKARNNPNEVLFSKGKPYSQNRGLDTNKDHRITVSEATAAVRRMFFGN